METVLESVLEEVVRPALAAHGGGIGAYSFQDGTFRFRFTGACAQCPSAWITAEQIVAESLMTRIPQVKTVLLEQGVDESLLNQAMDILKRRDRSGAPSLEKQE